MELQLEELIRSIKEEGINAAELQKESMLTEAKSEAERIIGQAEKEAADKIAEAEMRARKFEESGKAALQQAGRDLILNLKKKIEQIFSRILISAVNENLDASVLRTLIPAVVSASGEKPADIKIAVSEKDAAELTNFLKQSLAGELEKGLEISPSARINAGFRMEIKDGSAYYDFSDEKIAQMLSVYLNPKIAELLDV
ncbi:MAG: hypothetical protein SOZ27_06720 [Spirochaetia bacterium]|nr:hypothetical protein [Spirochaetia bacterium]